VSDEQRRLDLIQRYAEKLGESETNVAAFLGPQNSKIISRIGPLPKLDDYPIEPTSQPKPVEAKASPPASDGRGIVEIDLDRLQKMGCVRPDADSKTELAEQFQIIKRPLIQKALATGPEAIRNANSILVTSARPGEGKSFTSVNLAMSIASERDLSVLLIDGDLFHHALPTILGVEMEKGLVDVLLDETIDVSDAVLRTNIPNLALLPAGRKHPQSTELYASQRMGRVMRQLASRYSNRIIVLDSPPALASTETSALASHSGQIVMVVEQNRTGWRLVEQSLARLGEHQEVNFILNKVDSLWDESYAAAYH